MSRQTAHRKSTSKSSATSAPDTSEKRSRRRSSKSKTRVVTESPMPAPRTPPSVPNLSQYFPSRKRSQSSPQTSSSLERKFTAIKSPSMRKRILVDNPITYGEECLEITPDKHKASTSLEPKAGRSVRVEPKSGTDIMEKFHSFLVQSSEDDEEEKMELFVAENQETEAKQIRTQDLELKNISQMVDDLHTQSQDITSSFSDAIDCVPNTRASDTNKTVIRVQSVETTQPLQELKRRLPAKGMTHQSVRSSAKELFKESAKEQNAFPKNTTHDSTKPLATSAKPKENAVNCQAMKTDIEDNQNQSISSEEKSAFEDDFDDDFDQIVSQMDFAIEATTSSSHSSMSSTNVKTNESGFSHQKTKESLMKDKNPMANGLGPQRPTESGPSIAIEEDDGFESDGSFEEALSQIPNDKLMNPLNDSHSELETTDQNQSSRSLSSSGMLTLSQIIELINNGSP